MYSSLGMGAPPLLTQTDIYGQGNGAATGATVNPASAPSSTGNQSNVPAISLVGLILALVLLRVAWEMGGEPGGS